MSVTESYVSIQVTDGASKKTPARRSELEIKMDVLQVISQGIDRPTQVMYKANLSWNVLQTQLKAFIDSDMIEVEQYGSRRKYLITPRGMEMISSYQRVEREILD